MNLSNVKSIFDANCIVVYGSKSECVFYVPIYAETDEQAELIKLEVKSKIDKFK